MPGHSSCRWHTVSVRFQFALSQSRSSRACARRVDVQCLCVLHYSHREVCCVICKLCCSSYEEGDEEGGHLAPGRSRHTVYKAMPREQNKSPERPSARIIRVCPVRRDLTGQSRYRRRHPSPALWASLPCPTRPACPGLSHRRRQVPSRCPWARDHPATRD